jgi:hypothetical protein
MNPAVVIPWRKGETELQSTIESAEASIGNGVIIPVEDVEEQGPGRTRDRGIMAATDSDVIVIVDAHMKFRGDVLRKMARRVARFDGLLCAVTHHNEHCEFNALHPTGHGAYYGADIHYKGHDGNGRQALVWKWQSARLSPGPVQCVGGACYVFRRDWYLRCGRPLAILPAWGGDEEVLSMACWLSGHMPHVYDGHVAHRWRGKAPWNPDANPAEAINIRFRCRSSIISAFVSDAADKADLLQWQRGVEIKNEAIERTKSALLKLPRKWAQWKAEVPVMERAPAQPEQPSKPVAPKPTPIVSGRANYGAHENRRTCAICQSAASSIVSMTRTGRMTIRYRKCLDCGTNRVTQEIAQEK